MSTLQEMPVEQKPTHAITVSVNEREVVIHQHEATGTEIKATAIAQGVPIQPDFALFEVEGHGTLKSVGDHETITLHEHEKFRAVAPDDNS